MFKNYGCEVYGTEFNKRAEDICRTKGIKILSGGLMPKVESNLYKGFDLIILTEVIEHINNPRDIINNISNLLKQDGYLYITTPNFSSIDRLIMGPQWGMICYPEHLTFWSPKTLNYFLKNLGYEKVFIRTENMSVFRFVQYLNERKTSSGKQPSLDPEKVAVLAQAYFSKNKFLSFAKNVINFFLKITGRGASLIALYRKTENGSTTIQ
jgi:2-polyprenyl-3-methyl-5-hydroxy-6-metoxy-1,4-benzoquinol methylase